MAEIAGYLAAFLFWVAGAAIGLAAGAFGFEVTRNAGLTVAVLGVVLAVIALFLSLSPNPPMDRDGRREDSGRGVRELQARCSGLEFE